MIGSKRIIHLNSTPAWVTQQFGAAGQVPNIAIDFRINKAWVKTGTQKASDQFVGITNSSGGYVDDTSNIWALIAANTLRRSNNWALFEESRTNSIRNNSMQGAVVGTPGTLPTNWVASYTANQGTLALNVIGTGTENGIDYIDIQLTGTPAGAGTMQLAFEAGSVIAASNAQNWGISGFSKIVAGSATNLTFDYKVNERAAGFLQSDVAVTFTPNASSSALGASRNSGIVTLANASTTNIVPFIDFNYAAAVSTNVTVRVGWPQSELGASITSPIRTTSAAAARNADVSAGVTIAPPGTSFTIATQATPQAPTTYSTLDQVALQIDDGTANNRFSLRRAINTGFATGAITASGSTNIVSGAAWSQNTRAKFIGAFAPSDQAISFAGGAVVTGANSMPSGLTTFRVGGIQSGAAQWLGGIATLAVWYSRIPNSNLVAWSGS